VCKVSILQSGSFDRKKKKFPKGILPSGRPLHTNEGDEGWMGIPHQLPPGLGRVSG
jgi:hypothetical protein